MDGILSQDEINALLSGMDLSGDSGSAGTTDTQEPVSGVSDVIDESLLTDTEKDAIGEIANISMGSSATTLYSLVNRKVNITTPVVTLANWDTVIEDYQKPCVFIQIRYTAGLDGSNIMVLKEQDVKVITDLMMGGDGSNTEGELGELHLSAISEAMNQMMGSAATSMSTMLGKMIDISPPEASLVDLQEFRQGSDIADFLSGTFVKISFRMQIDDLVDSTIMQLYPIEFAKSLYETFISSQAPEPEPVQEREPEPYIPPVVESAPQPDMSQMNSQMGMQPGYGMPQPDMQNMNIQPAQFQSFSGTGNVVAGQENIGLIMDVPLEVTVELGRTTKSIKDILEFSQGTIIELERQAGAPVDVMVNGNLIARGDVVVIDDNFAVRITEIVKSKFMDSLGKGE